MLSAPSGCSGTDETSILPLLDSLSVVSFNTALGVGLAEYPEQRLDAIERDLPALGADVICLQEVWQHADVERLAAALQPDYPYAHFSVQPSLGGAAAEKGVAACTEAESDLLLGCLTGNCAGLPERELPLCAITQCADDFASVSMTCQQCVIANQQSEPADIARACANADAEVAAFRDQNGLLLLSRWPLSELDFRRMSSSLGDRGILAARLDAHLTASVDVLCTHLTPAFSDIPYTGALGSWEAERDHHVSELVRFAGDRDDGGLKTLIGDMNCGPETSLSAGAGPEAFAAFGRAGYSSPYAESDNPACTFCSSNPLVGAAPRGSGDVGVILDHVLLSTPRAPLDVTARRVLDQGIEIESEGGVIETSHSDHYGVMVTLERPAP